MTATASIPFVKLAERKEQLFKNHNIEATMEISIDVPAWLLKDFSGMIQCLEGTALEFYMYRFHFGSLTVKDWEDQSFQVTFSPYFPLVAYTDVTQNDKIGYARVAFVKDYGLQPIAERNCIDLSLPPPMIQFFGVVDTRKFVLAENPNIGLDETTRNCSAIFLTWSKFPDLQNAVMPESGWYPNYVYAMLPKTKKHLTQKCEGYKAASTQFRQHGRKAYIRGYMHGFCHKANMFTDDGRPSSLDFVPFVEIMDVDWVSAAASGDGNQNVPATPRKFAKPDTASSKGKRKIAFDPCADSGVASSLSFGDKLMEAKSGQTGRSEDSGNDLEVIDMRDLGQGMPDSHDDVTDEPSPSKKAKLGSRKRT
ncbi:hypothetical protein V8E54_013312 [Elaphomyces granulatus]